MKHETTDEMFESRIRTGVPMVRAAACRAWSAGRCAGELDALIDAGAHVLVRAATEAANDTEFLARLLGELPGALHQAANDTAEEEERP